MWRIIKSELEYLKPAIIAVYALFILNMILRAILVYWHFHGREVEFIRLDSILYVESYIVDCSLILTFIMLFLQVKENRLRQTGTLPVPIWGVGLSRILAPTSLVVIFMILSMMECASEPYPFRPMLRYGDSLVYAMLFASWAWGIPGWLYTTYWMCLFMEHWGRIFLGIMLAIYIGYYGVFPAINGPVSWRVQDWLAVWYRHNLWHDEWLIPVIAGIFAGIIFLSFMKRRSYLA
jgi:hypothetical protein